MVAVLSRDEIEQTGRSRRGAKPGAVTLVVGLGATGLSVAQYLTARGEPVAVIDTRPAPPARAALAERVPGAATEFGRLDERWLERARRVVVSPGLPADLPLLRAARARGLEVVGDVELFARAAPAPVLAVTGSNGKSSVVTLVARILAAQGFTAPAGGNLGPPALTLLDAPRPDVYVLEISSFQMETTDSLSPLAAAVLNLTADHLDRHGTFERYAALKSKVLAAAATAVYNYDDPIVREMGARHARAIPYSTRVPLAAGYSIVERAGAPWLAHDLEPLLAADSLAQQGTHNWGNALAALALSSTLGGDTAPALAALASYEGLPHRCERVAEIGGVTYIDDSKGTNVGATIAAVEGMRAPVVLIAGGAAKGADFTELARRIGGRLKGAVLIGEAAGALEDALAASTTCVRAASMGDAVAAAAGLAAPGDTVLLSPACASFDMFRDYADRGDAFRRAVGELAA